LQLLKPLTDITSRLLQLYNQSHNFRERLEEQQDELGLAKHKLLEVSSVYRSIVFSWSLLLLRPVVFAGTLNTTAWSACWSSGQPS